MKKTNIDYRLTKDKKENIECRMSNIEPAYRQAGFEVKKTTSTLDIHHLTLDIRR